MERPWPRQPARDEAEKRLARVLRILRAIQEGPRRWTRAEFAEHFQVSERQVDNDLRLLRAVGYPIRRRRGGYVIAGQPGDELAEEERRERRRAGSRRRARALRERRKEAGLCIACGSPASAGHTRCSACLARLNDSDAQRRRSAKSSRTDV